MEGADKSMQGFGTSIQNQSASLRKLGIGMVAFGGIVTGVLGLAVKQASDAEEMMSKFRVVFRDQAPEVEKWAETLATAVNRSRFEIMGMAASLQDTFVPMGFAREEAARLSKDLTTLAIDVASFNNKLDEEVLRDFQSALVGNTETVRKYGIVITATQVEQDILNRGWVTSKSEITEAMKVQARYNMIVEGSTDAIGDAERTSGSFANQMKGLQASIKDTAVEVGNVLLPILSGMIDWMRKVIKGVTDWMSENKGLTKAIILTAGAVGVLMLAVGPLLIALPSLVSGFIILRTFLLTKMIPTIVATTTALWAKVAALLAVLAAAGPVGWAVLAAGIALIGLTTAAVTLKIKDMLRGVTEETEEATESTNKFTDALQTGGEQLNKFWAAVKQPFKDAEEAQLRLNEALTAQRLELERILELRRAELKTVAAAFRAGVITWETFIALEKQTQGPVATQQVALPWNAGPQQAINTANYNVNATYTNPQDPASIMLDMEALALAAGR